MTTIEGSFRDPNGFVFQNEAQIYRQINLAYKENYHQLMESGAYESLTEAKLLVSHEEVEIEGLVSHKAYKIIKPERIPFVSYPYEWCFSQLKDAALVTLDIQKRALAYDMSLKDCSAYNIQFLRGKPIFIDTLSFEKYQEGKPWVAYRQFCQHFLAPLALMSHKDIRLNQLLRIYIDGVPLDLASSLLPLPTKLYPGLLFHIHIHQKSQKRFEQKFIELDNKRFNLKSLLGLIDSLESAVKRLKWHPTGTEWADYYQDTNYSAGELAEKHRIVKDFLDELKPQVVWDLGANEGIFSRLASDSGIYTLSLDVDPAAVERNYLKAKEKGEECILPLLFDLVNPSPAIGWENHERLALRERGTSDTVLALALVHHLAISNNLPLGKIAKFFSECCKSLIIEFVPKSDPQIKRLLISREDIFIDYNEKNFEEKFREYFNIVRSKKMDENERILYLMVKRE